MSRIAVVGIVGESVFLPVDHFHIGGETLEAESFQTEPGGKGFNQAVAAARFGAEVSFFAAVGDEGYAETVRDYLKKDGIRPVLAEKHGRTAYAVIITDKAGSNHVTEYTGVKLVPEDVSLFAEDIAAADILLINNEVSEKVNLACAEIARQNGTRVICNPAPYREMSEKLKAYVMLFTPNEHETEGLDGCDNCIVTLGGKGCFIRSTGETVPATDDIPVDTTGAGDTFNGVLAAELASGREQNAAVRLAVRASGLSVTRKGAVSSIPYASELQKINNKKKGTVINMAKTVKPQEGLNMLLEKYSVKDSAVLDADGKNVTICGVSYPLLPWESERRFTEMRDMYKNRLGNICTYRIGHTGNKRDDLSALLLRETGILEFTLGSKAKKVFSISGGNAMNCIIETENGCIATLELSNTLDNSQQPIDKHELMTDNGMVCDRVVDTQVPQQSIYVYSDKMQTFCDTDAELYGCTELEINTVRNAFALARDPALREHNAAEYAHLLAVVRASYESLASLEDKEVASV